MIATPEPKQKSRDDPRSAREALCLLRLDEQLVPRRGRRSQLDRPQTARERHLALMGTVCRDEVRPIRIAGSQLLILDTGKDSLGRSVELGTSYLDKVSMAPAIAPGLARLDQMNASPRIQQALPGADLIERGIADLDARQETIEALLVSIGAPRLRSLGFELASPFDSPEHRLYLRLAREKGNAAHSAYNGLIRRLVSFERATQCVS